MPDIGIRELKARASEVVREVRESRARYVVTHRGRPVALITPLASGDESDRSDLMTTADSAWDELTQLGEDIGRDWQAPKSSVELLSEMRR